MHKSRKLFGGALFTAGLTMTATSVASATGDTFPFDTGFDNSVGVGFIYGTGGGFLDSAEGPNGTAPGSAMGSYTDQSGSTLGGTATLTDKLMRVEAYGIAQVLAYGPGGSEYFTDGWAYSIAETRVVSASDLWIHASWDREGNGLHNSGRVFIRNTSTGVLEVDTDGQVSGSFIHMLNSGDTYTIVITATTDPDLGGLSWAQVVVVPSPAGVALLGCAMLIGRRRRRQPVV